MRERERERERVFMLFMIARNRESGRKRECRARKSVSESMLRMATFTAK